MKKQLLLLSIASTLIIGCLPKGGEGSSGTSDTALTDSSAIIADTLSSAAVVDNSYNWNYSEDEDKMTSKKVYYAQVAAKDRLHFDFPYDGGSIANLNIRKKQSGIDIYLTVSKGQFNSRYEDNYVTLRFDNLPAKRYEFLESSSGDNDIVFLSNEASVINKLKKHNKLLIEAEFYQSGNHVMEFDISNFKWNH
jgi:hypothetical protein